MWKKVLKIFKKTSSQAKNNLGDFIDEEKREINELRDGKEDIHKYFHDSAAIFKDYFIPNDNNENRPKILRPKQLAIIAILLVTLKIFSIGYLFLVYQESAQMSETSVSQILALTNAARTSEGIPALNLNPALNKAAQTKAEDMAINNYFSHTSPDGRKPWDFVNRSEYAYLLIGENLAINFIQADDAHTALMESPSHRKNILNTKYSDIGLAIISGKLDGNNTNILVEIFGAKNDTKSDTISAPSVVAPEIVSSTAKDETKTTQTVVVKADETLFNSSTENELKPKTLINTSTKVTSPLATIKATSTTPTSRLAPSATSTQDLATTSNVLATSTNQIETSNLILNDLPEEPSFVDVSVNPKVETAAGLANWSKKIYIGFIIFLILALMVNIIVRVTIQHKSVIAQTLLLIALILSLLLIDLNFMKEIEQAAKNIAVF